MNFKQLSSKNCSIKSDKLKVTFVKKELALIKEKLAQVRAASGNKPKIDAKIAKISSDLRKLVEQDKSVSDMWRRLYDYYFQKKGATCASAMQNANRKFKTDSNYKRLVVNLVANADNLLRTMICDATAPLTVSSCPVIHSRRSGSQKSKTTNLSDSSKILKTLSSNSRSSLSLLKTLLSRSSSSSKSSIHSPLFTFWF